MRLQRGQPYLQPINVTAQQRAWASRPSLPRSGGRPTATASHRIVTTDPETVAVLRRLVEQVGDTLTGDGPLAGPFIGLHRAIRAGVAHHKITPTSDSNRSSSPLRTCSLCIVAVQSRYASSCGR